MTARALVGNSADAQQVKHGRKKEQGRREQQIRDWQDVLASPAGKRVIWAILDFCRVYDTGAVFGDPTQTYYIAGQRSVGLHMMQEIEAANPQAMLEMIVMAKSEQEIDRLTAPKQEPPVEDEDDGN